MGEIFQVLESQAHQTSMMMHKGIRTEKRGLSKMTKHTVSLSGTAPEEMSLSGGEDTIDWIRKWHH